MAAPHTSQAAAAGARGGVRGELAVELGEERNTVGEPKFGAGRSQRGVLRQRRKKLAPGSGWNTGIPAPQGTWTKIGIAIVGLVLGWLCYSIASNILTYMHTTPKRAIRTADAYRWFSWATSRSPEQIVPSCSPRAGGVRTDFLS